MSFCKPVRKPASTQLSLKLGTSFLVRAFVNYEVFFAFGGFEQRLVAVSFIKC
jgi:hypothetical protein